VPVTVCPAFTWGGNDNFAATSATGTPVTVAVAVLLAGFGSVVVLLTVEATIEVPEAGCV